jgi:hypothetical protein
MFLTSRGVDGDGQDQGLAFVDPRSAPVAAGPDPYAGAISALWGWVAHARRSAADVDLTGSGNNTTPGLA